MRRRLVYFYFRRSAQHLAYEILLTAPATGSRLSRFSCQQQLRCVTRVK